MRTLPAYCALILPLGCASIQHSPGDSAAGVRGPDTAPAVILTQAEFDDFLTRTLSRPGAYDADGFVRWLEAARPDFERQILVLVRHDASSGSTFSFNSSGQRHGTMTCDIRTRRSGSTRDMVPYWFAAAIDRPAPDRIEVHVDGQLQPGR